MRDVVSFAVFIVVGGPMFIIGLSIYIVAAPLMSFGNWLMETANKVRI